MGLNGQVTAARVADVNFANLWNALMVNNDLSNSATRTPPLMILTHVTCALAQRSGAQRAVLASFVASMSIPGIPLVSQDLNLDEFALMILSVL